MELVRLLTNPAISGNIVEQFSALHIVSLSWINRQSSMAKVSRFHTNFLSFEEISIFCKKFAQELPLHRLNSQNSAISPSSYITTFSSAIQESTHRQKNLMQCVPRHPSSRWRPQNSTISSLRNPRTASTHYKFLITSQDYLHAMCASPKICIKTVKIPTPSTWTQLHPTQDWLTSDRKQPLASVNHSLHLLIVS